MKRRVLLGAIGAAAGSPSILRAQAKPVIGYLSGRSLATDGHLLTAVREGLKEAGYVDGQNVTMDFRWAEGRFERLEALASHLCTAVAINSLPLSDLMFTGGPRAMNSSANAASTSS